MVVFRLCELRYANERSTKFESLYHELKYSEGQNDKVVALQVSSKIESLCGLGRPTTKI